MFRGPLALAALLEVAQSHSLHLSALEEFSADFHDVVYHVDEEDGTITTSPLPWIAEDHSSLALHVRNLQAKLNWNFRWADGAAIGPIPVGGMNEQEEMHIDGKLGRASLHFASPILNICFQLDSHINFAQQMASSIGEHVQQAEQMEPMIAQHLERVTVDGEEAVALVNPHDGSIAAFTPDSTHPVLYHIHLSEQELQNGWGIIDTNGKAPSEYVLHHLAFKFDNYRNTVGNEFDVRACEIQSHANSQALLAANPAVKDFVASRLALHQGQLQAVFQTFNKTFIPVEIEDLMVPVALDCATEELAQSPPQAWSTMQAATCSMCAFATGIAVTLMALRKKHVAPAEEALLSAQA